MRFASFLTGLLLTGCAATIVETRDEGPPRIEIPVADFDKVVGCIGETVAGKYDLNYTPSSSGGSFFYTSQTPTYGGKSSILIDVSRGQPGAAKVFFTGGPWLGRDEAIVRGVRACAG